MVAATELVILYGPPAVGKLTVAQALAEGTGYKVFHHHLTTDLVTSLFPFGSETMVRLTMTYRVEMLAEAASVALRGVIHTVVYAAGTDDDFMQRLDRCRGGPWWTRDACPAHLRDG